MSCAVTISEGTVIEVPKKEFEELVRASEKLEIIKNFYKSNNYISVSDMLVILDIKKDEVKKNED